MPRRFLVLTVLLFAACSTKKVENVKLENSRMVLVFDARSGALLEVGNKLTGESYGVLDGHFALETDNGTIDFAGKDLESAQSKGDVFETRFRKAGCRLQVQYRLLPERHFAEKRLTIAVERPSTLKSITAGRFAFTAPDLKLSAYRYQKNMTCFGRTPKGGFFAGVEVPLDASSVAGNQVTLAYAPALKLTGGDPLESEPAYLGVYRRSDRDREDANLPLQSESDAMVAMTSALVGPPRHGLVPMACGWWCEMEHGAFDTDAKVEGDMRSLDFLAECGVDWVSDSHPWGGETEKMNRLVDDQKYEIGERVRRLLEHARKVGVKVVMWPTMTNTNEFYRPGMKKLGALAAVGEPFRPDKPEWVQVPEGRAVRHEHGPRSHVMYGIATCLANKPFLSWLTGIHEQGMATGYYRGWAMDGDFVGSGAYVGPVACPSAVHDHAPGDATYGSQRALDQLVKSIRQRFPSTFIWLLRPPMDLGIWSHRNADSSFTINEWAELQPLPGLKDQPVNVVCGDKIRLWSRVRVHQHFFPHYLDQPQVFIAPESMKSEGEEGHPWPSEKIDYVMLSAFSCSPNQLYYLPTKKGIPRQDKHEIRKWLDWGRANVRYLQVRKDLPGSPGAGRVDGSAHVATDQGLVFLFNPNKDAMDGEFWLTEESIGLDGKGNFTVTQIYPVSRQSARSRQGEKVSWKIPGETALILRIQPAT